MGTLVGVRAVRAIRVLGVLGAIRVFGAGWATGTLVFLVLYLMLAVWVGPAGYPWGYVSEPPPALYTKNLLGCPIVFNYG